MSQLPQTNGTIERAQLGGRIEKRLVKVLKGLAELEEVSLGELLGKIVVHSFGPGGRPRGRDGVEPHSKNALDAIANLKRAYRLDFDMDDLGAAQHHLGRAKGRPRKEAPRVGRTGASFGHVTRIAYLGNPQISVPALEALVLAGHEVILVVTGEDRRRGRGGATSPSPLKAVALELGLPTTSRLGDVRGRGIELGVVVAFGRLIPASVLADVAMINLHFSLLPRWRGAAPLERAILAQDRYTGACVMAVEEGLDTGALYARAQVEIGPDEHLGELATRLAATGAALLVEVLSAGLAGMPEPLPQSGEATYANKLTADELRIDWASPSAQVLALVRLDGAFTTIKGARLRILEARGCQWGGPVQDPLPGTLCADVVATGDGAIRLVRVQPQGGRAMPAPEWIRGRRLGQATLMGSDG
ncbi:MAG: methionyl-tRNA formyltransferase [Acidimicrobiales bacterium]